MYEKEESNMKFVIQEDNGGGIDGGIKNFERINKIIGFQNILG